MSGNPLWKNVRFLIRYESRRTYWGWIWSVIIFSCFALTAVTLLSNTTLGSDASKKVISYYMLDLFFLSIVGSLGFAILSKDYRSSWWTRQHITRKLVFMKSLPISAVEIIVSRISVFLITLLMLGTCFFSILYFFSWPMLPLNGREYIHFVLIWVGYSLALGGVYIYLECALKEMTYLIWSILIMILFIILVIALQWSGIYLVEQSIRIARQYGLAGPLFSIIGGSLILAGCARQATRKLERREFG